MFTKQEEGAVSEMSDAFISYSSYDKDWVEPLIKNLKRFDIDIWWDKGEINPGDSWVLRINQGLADCKKIVLIVSPASMASFRVINESGSIIAQFKDNLTRSSIIPVVLHHAPLPPLLQERHYIDFSNLDEDGYFDSVKSLAKAITSKKSEDLVPYEPLELPPPLSYEIPNSVWMSAATLFSSQFKTKRQRKSFASELRVINPDLPDDALEHFPSLEMAASALLFEYGALDPEKLKALIEKDQEDLESTDGPMYRYLIKEIDGIINGDVVAPHKNVLLQQFLKTLEDECNRDLLGPLFPQAGQKYCKEVYVALHTTEYDAKKGGKADNLEKFARMDHDLSKREDKTLLDYIEGDLSRKWTLQGDPGSGKTTLLLYITLTLCDRAKAASQSNKSSDNLIPVFVSINDWHESGLWIWPYLNNRYSKLGIKDIKSLLTGEVSSGRVIWLLDGFDEVISKRAQEASLMIQRLAQEMKPCHVVMTSRRFGYTKPDKDFTELKLLPLSATAQKELLCHFTAKTRADEILIGVEAHRSLKEIAGNPFFLSLIGLVASQEPDDKPYSLPRRRGALLERVEGLLLESKPGRRNQPLPHRHKTRNVLEYLALKLLHRGAGPYSEDLIDEQLFGYETASKLLTKWPGSNAADTTVFINDVASHTGLLCRQGFLENRWSYLHRSIQEHMAARSLLRQGKSSWESLAKSLVLNEAKGEEQSIRLGQWAETFAYLAGEVDDPDEFLTWLMEINPELGFRALATADHVKQDTLQKLLNMSPGGDEWEKRREIIESIPERLGPEQTTLQLLKRIRRGATHGADLYFISEAYKLIASKANDPNIKLLANEYERDLFNESLSLPDDKLQEICLALQKITVSGKEADLWCDIPAGAFKMGSPKKEKDRFDDEPAQIKIKLSGFKLASAPVTNRMYELFHPYHSEDRAFKDEVDITAEPDHPVVNITWYEATMFCRWATEILQRQGIISTTASIHLPSEAQWEYACRGKTSTRFWSGDEDGDLGNVGWYEANSDDRTHAVGEKRSNLWGLYDMHGNVWEWCRDIWSDPYQGKGSDPIIEDHEGGSYRVIRGGGWFIIAWICRSAFRYWIVPDFRYNYLGFRLARS